MNTDNILEEEIKKMSQLHRLIMETAYCCVINDISPEELTNTISEMTKSKLKSFTREQIIAVHESYMFNPTIPVV